MNFRIARIDKNVVAEIFEEGQGPVALYDKTLDFKHLKTWIVQGDSMATKYNLVAITTPERPEHDPLKQNLILVPAVVGGQPLDSWAIVNRPVNEARNEFLDRIKDRAWSLWGRASWSKTRAEWLDYRDALKTHGTAMAQAFNQDKKVDLLTGSIDGVGGWPV